ncbi:hypothetical protein CYMTET_3533 [Cymbomonas tetramitiformis]|uniref:Uncharacterized protein n=1 Tax=Cymbomonas tetramitiformis TaxID=36881 RepID=A0AAE0LKR1_9CHLO|nr:hypothetical protein CYMTET_3533 [Cymbomonas tetramitiformis]
MDSALQSFLAWFRTARRSSTTASSPTRETFGHQDAWRLWRRALCLAWDERACMLGALLAAVVTSLCEVSRSVLYGEALGIVSGAALTASGGTLPELSAPSAEIALDASAEDVSRRLTWVFLRVCAVESARTLAAYFRERLTNNVGDFVCQRARASFFRQVLRSELSFLDEVHTAILNRRYAHLSNLHSLAGHQLPKIVQATLTLACTVTYLLRSEVRVGGALLGVLLVGALVEEELTRLQLATWQDLNEVECKTHRLREESFTHAHTVKSFSCEEKLSARFIATLSEDRRIRQRVVHLQAARAGLSCGFMALSLGLVWYLGLHSVLAGRIASVGTVTAIVALATQVKAAYTPLVNAYRDSFRRAMMLQEAFLVMDRVPEMAAGGIVLPKGKGLVELRDVTFRYPARPETTVLSHLSMTLRGGAVTALCGPSGGGKSSIVGLMLRHYDPQIGSVHLDGVDLRECEASSLRKLMAVVSQEPVLFSTSVEENITFGLRDGHSVSQEEVEAVSQLANAHDFIMGLEHGYQTEVGERGGRLSGGQKQRIAIARAILMDPAILILDEATSALDADAERAVQATLERVMVGRTTLTIAHRLSTIKEANQIVVIVSGRVVEQGRQIGFVAIIVIRTTTHILAKRPAPSHIELFVQLHWSSHLSQTRYGRVFRILDTSNTIYCMTPG